MASNCEAITIAIRAGPKGEGDVTSFVLDGCDVVWIIDSPLENLLGHLGALESLEVCSSLKVSREWMVGRFCSSTENAHHLFTTLPMDLIAAVITLTLTEQSLHSFFTILKSLTPELTIYRIDDQEITPLEADQDIEMSSSSVWTLLALADVFSAPMVFTECAKRLHRILCINGCAQPGRGDISEVKLPNSIISPLVESLSTTTLQSLAGCLLKHFHNFGPIPYTEPVTDVVSPKPRSRKEYKPSGHSYHHESLQYQHSLPTNTDVFKYYQNATPINASKGSSIVPGSTHSGRPTTPQTPRAIIDATTQTPHTSPEDNSPSPPPIAFSTDNKKYVAYKAHKGYGDVNNLVAETSEAMLKRRQNNRASHMLAFSLNRPQNLSVSVPSAFRYKEFPNEGSCGGQPALASSPLPIYTHSLETNISPTVPSPSSFSRHNISLGNLVSGLSYYNGDLVLDVTRDAEWVSTGDCGGFCDEDDCSADGNSSHLSDVVDTSLDSQSSDHLQAVSTETVSANTETDNNNNSDNVLSVSEQNVEKEARRRAISRLREYRRSAQPESNESIDDIRARNSRLRAVQMAASVARISSISHKQATSSSIKSTDETSHLIDEARRSSSSVVMSSTTSSLNHHQAGDDLQPVNKDFADEQAAEHARLRAIERIREAKRRKELKEREEQKQRSAKKEKMLRDRNCKISKLLERQRYPGSQPLEDLLLSQDSSGRNNRTTSYNSNSHEQDSHTSIVPLKPRRSHSPMTTRELDNIDMDPPPPPPPPLPLPMSRKTQSSGRVRSVSPALGNSRIPIASSHDANSSISRFHTPRPTTSTLETSSEWRTSRSGLKPLDTFSPDALAAVGLSPDDLLINLSLVGSAQHSYDDIEQSLGIAGEPALMSTPSTKHVIDSATEVQNMIDSILNTPASPSPAKLTVAQPYPQHPHLPQPPAQAIPTTTTIANNPHSRQYTTNASTSEPVTKAPPSLSDVVSVTVVRAWGLSEGLGGTNPYVVVDWGNLGRSSTQSIPSTTCPTFDSILKFKSPLRRVLLTSKQGVPNVCGVVTIGGIEYFLQDVSMRLSVYSRNISVSDELLGEATLTASGQLLEYFNDMYSEASAVVPLTNLDGQAVGYLELCLSFT